MFTLGPATHRATYQEPAKRLESADVQWLAEHVLLLETHPQLFELSTITQILQCFARDEETCLGMLYQRRPLDGFGRFETILRS